MKNDQTEKTQSEMLKTNLDSAIKAETAKNIEDHRKAAAHHMQAAKHSLEAANYHETGDHEKAAQNTLLAYGHAAIAGGFLNDDAKHHAQELKETNYR